MVKQLRRKWAKTPIAFGLAVGLLVLMVSLALAGDLIGTGTNLPSSDVPSPNEIHGHRINKLKTPKDVKGVTISGGGAEHHPNTVIGNFGTVGGGWGNTAGQWGTVGGGLDNEASTVATIAGGRVNKAIAEGSTIGGGCGNVAGDGHVDNTACGGPSGQPDTHNYSTVGGGVRNLARGEVSTIAGGGENVAAAEGSSIGGGIRNRAEALVATIAGGHRNKVTGDYGSIGGGSHNEVNGIYGVVPGGIANVAGGKYSFAAGRNARARHDGAFVWADCGHCADGAPDFVSTAPNQFSVRATGGVRFVTAVDSHGNQTAGVRLKPGDTGWSVLSDRNLKDNLIPVNSQQILAQLVSIPIQTWNLQSQEPAIRHIGPTAQDFYAAFAVGGDDTHINTVDADGVALAAIQGLYQVVQAQNTQLAQVTQQMNAVQAENKTLHAEMDQLQQRIAAIEARTTTAASPAEAGLLADWRLWALAFVGMIGLLVRRRRA